jgi:hypothetical protein
MTGARVELIEPDPWLAASFLERARQFEASAVGLPSESRQVLLHSAVVAACDGCWRSGEGPSRAPRAAMHCASPRRATSWMAIITSCSTCSTRRASFATTCRTGRVWRSPPTSRRRPPPSASSLSWSTRTSRPTCPTGAPELRRRPDDHQDRELYHRFSDAERPGFRGRARHEPVTTGEATALHIADACASVCLQPERAGERIERRAPHARVVG